VIEPAAFQLWWAGKDMQRGKCLHEYIGKNEKTKIVGKIQRRGGGAPVREAVYDEQTQKEMMAYAYKKQEEWKVRIQDALGIAVEINQSLDGILTPWLSCRSWRRRRRTTT